MKQLEPSPELQLEYLKRILAKREEGLEVSDNYLILHIKLLSRLCPEEIFHEVERHNYPLEECLKICRDYNVKDALAFFLEKAGNIIDALDTWLEVSHFI